MGKIGPIVMIGFALFAGGIYWHLWHDSISVLEKYILNDEYYTLIRFGWDAIPVVMLIVGIIWLIQQGTAGSRQQRVVYE